MSNNRIEKKAKVSPKARQMKNFGLVLIGLSAIFLYLSYWIPSLQIADPATIPSYLFFLTETDPMGFAVFSAFFAFLGIFTLGGSTKY
jgi:hypothetical protein